MLTEVWFYGVTSHILFTDHSKAMLLLWILFLLFMFRVCHALQACGHLLGKGWPIGWLVCDIFVLCFCHFPMWFPESGLVLDCINF